MPESRNSNSKQVRFATEGGNSCDDLVRFPLAQRALEGHNSHDKQVGFASEGCDRVECVG